MIALLSGVEFWHWWVLGVALVILEMVAPGTVLLWMGVSAGFTGLALFLLPGLAWEYQLLIFAAFSVATIFLSWKYLRKHPIRTDEPALNRRGERYVGRLFTLSEPIIGGRGKLKVEDTIWKVAGADLPEGARVKVTGVDGTTLTVEEA